MPEPTTALPRLPKKSNDFEITRGAEIYITAKSMRDELLHVINFFSDDAQVKYEFRLKIRNRLEREKAAAKGGL